MLERTVPERTFRRLERETLDALLAMDRQSAIETQPAAGDPVESSYRVSRVRARNTRYHRAGRRAPA